MDSYIEISVGEKDELCKSLYRDEILKSADFLAEYEEFAKIGEVVLPVSCHTNFRDALFHFRKLCHSVEKNEILQQAFAVKEHLHRARTDARVSLLQYFSKAAEELLARGDIDAAIKADIRRSLHKMKDVSMVNRMKGMMMSEMGINPYSDNDITKIFEEYFDLLNDKCTKQFLEVRAQFKSNGENTILC